MKIIIKIANPKLIKKLFRKLCKKPGVNLCLFAALIAPQLTSRVRVEQRATDVDIEYLIVNKPIIVELAPIPTCP